MEKKYFEEVTFEKIDFAGKGITKGNYEDCIFLNCNFANLDLSGIHFLSCKFIVCNVSMAGLEKTAFKNVAFKDCKLAGLRFDICEPFLFELAFDTCIVSLSSFFKVKLRETKFSNSILHEIDFTEADLHSAVFDRCDLAGSIFENTILEKADFRTAYNYSINPELNKIKKAKFSKAGIAGLLDKFDIEIE
jgi:fluoroquinolone resistance protein